jgi:hypothetical protein
VFRRIGNLNLRPWIWVTAITLLTTLCVWGVLVIAPWERLVPDFICYWSASELLASGHSPYDIVLQSEIQHRLGWEKATNGRGVLDFLPYYYPPWFALALTLFLPLGFQAAKAAWFSLNLEVLFLTGFLLRNAVEGLPRSIPLVAVPLFFLSVLALILGQTSILIVFLVTLAWKLLDRRWDRSAGAVLACVITKPQLTALLVLTLVLWAARRRRWGVLQGFAIALAALSLASMAIVPSWPLEMLAATRQTPPPTDHFPWLGTAWFLVLRSVGLRSWGLWALYLAVAIPFALEVLKSAIDASRTLQDVMALGLLASFFIAPYGRHYDFPALLIPFFVLLGGRLSEKAGSALLLALIVIPYIQFILLVKYSYLLVGNISFFLECTYFWVPAVLALAWFATRSKSSEARI